MPINKAKTFGDVISAIQDSCSSDAEAIAKLESLIRARKLQFDQGPQAGPVRPAEPVLRLVHSRPGAAAVSRTPAQRSSSDRALVLAS